MRAAAFLLSAFVFAGTSLAVVPAGAELTAAPGDGWVSVAVRSAEPFTAYVRGSPSNASVVALHVFAEDGTPTYATSHGFSSARPLLVQSRVGGGPQEHHWVPLPGGGRVPLERQVELAPGTYRLLLWSADTESWEAGVQGGASLEVLARADGAGGRQVMRWDMMGNDAVYVHAIRTVHHTSAATHAFRVGHALFTLDLPRPPLHDAFVRTTLAGPGGTVDCPCHYDSLTGPRHAGPGDYVLTREGTSTDHWDRPVVLAFVDARVVEVPARG